MFPKPCFHIQPLKYEGRCQSRIEMYEILYMNLFGEMKYIELKLIFFVLLNHEKKSSPKGIIYQQSFWVHQYSLHCLTHTDPWALGKRGMAHRWMCVIHFISWHCSDVARAAWRFKLLSTRIFVSNLVRYNKNVSPVLLDLCEDNQSATDGFPSQRDSNAKTFPGHML